MASVFQKCKSGEPPCDSARCGHPWTVRYREPGGRTARQWEKSFPRKKEADAFASKVEYDKNQGLYLDPNRGAITVRAWVEEWLDNHAPISPKTQGNYRGFMEKWVVPNIGRKSLSGLSNSDIQNLVNTMHQGGLSASTVSVRFQVLRSMMNAALRDKRISDNPCDGTMLPRKGSKRVSEDEIPTLSQVQAIADHMPDRYRLAVWLMAGCGLRISEALAFSADCVRGDIVRVGRQVSTEASRVDCTKPFTPLKHRTADDYRDVPLPPFLATEIAAHVDQWGTGDVDGYPVLFPRRQSGRGQMPTVHTYRHVWDQAVSDAGLQTKDGKPKFTPHDLRHFFASTALAGGIPIVEVSRWLGHRSIQVTVDIYGHLTQEAPERFRTVMQDALRPALKAVS